MVDHVEGYTGPFIASKESRKVASEELVKKIRVELTEREAATIKKATKQKTVVGGVRALLKHYQSLEFEVQRAEFEQDTKVHIKEINDKLGRISDFLTICADTNDISVVRRLLLLLVEDIDELKGTIEGGGE